MTSRPARSGRIGFLLRMAPELKLRVVAAAAEDGVSVNDLLIAAIEQVLAFRDAEVVAGERKADLERRLEMKFEQIVVSLAGGTFTSLSAKTLTKLHEQAEAAIKKWRDHAASNHHAEPRSPLERLIRDYQDIEIEIEGGTRHAVRLRRLFGITTTIEDDDDDRDFDNGDFDDANDPDGAD